ncbi:MAG TPA: hypothetical protein VFN61_07515 [Acidimicrobiales bacterium]|nr:hypothetical protein [Acidimicrobiales bacterium]
MGLIFWFAALVIGGFVIGLLARLVVKTPHKPAFFETVLYGWGGWLLGSVAAAILFRGSANSLVKLATEVAAAALLIVIVTGRRAKARRI